MNHGESHACGKISRMDYIIDLISNYCPTLDDLCQECHDVIIVAYTDENEPMTDGENNQLYKATFPIQEKRSIKTTLICGNADDVAFLPSLQSVVEMGVWRKP